MDAGAPLKRPCAGIAMGLIKEDRGFAVLSDILGDEDHLGDMDFKVAGHGGGRDLPPDGHLDHLHHLRHHAPGAGPGARRRLHILGEMAKGHQRRRGDEAATAPRITVININKDKIRDVIAPAAR
jgi:polyribonucleotide nucleotidyltransferase